jgi:VanZ family protein
MLVLLAVFAFLLLAGSLFPWSFTAGPDLTTAAGNVLTDASSSLRWARRSDVLINLVIYAPIGFTGFLWRGWRNQSLRWLGVWLAGTTLSFGIETLQHYFPPRMPGALDILCNSLSTLGGAGLAWSFEKVLALGHIEWRRTHSVRLSSALMLLLVWSASLIWPDRAFPLGIGMRVRALLLPGPWSAAESIEAGLTWLLAGALLTAVFGSNSSRWWLAALLPVVFPVMLISPGHDFTWSYLGGALLSVLLFALAPESRRRAGVFLAVAWVVWIASDGVRPYNFTDDPGRYGLIPFKDMLGAPWMSGVGVLLRKTWIYGSAFWLLLDAGLCRSASLGTVVAVVNAVELAQRYLPSRVAGQTDPAIALLAAALIWVVDRRFGHGRGGSAAGLTDG